MYEHFRNDLATHLSLLFNSDDTLSILSILDTVMYNYDITEKSTELAVRIDPIPQEVITFIQVGKLEGKSKGTLKLYALRLRQFFEVVNKPVAEVTTQDIRVFLANYSKRDIKGCTLDKFRQILHVFFKWCFDEKYISNDPCSNIKQIKFEDVHRKALNKMQIELLRRACETKLERALVETLLSTGCRIRELCNMKWSEINVTNKSISVLGKGKSRYTVYFSESAQLALNEYFDSRSDKKDWLFVGQKNPHNQLTPSNAEKIFRKLSSRTGFYVCPHILRHTMATALLQGGCPIDVVQKALNHQSVATTQRYAETLQSDVESAHRRYIS